MLIYKQFLTILFLVLFISCNDQSHISGSIDYLGDSQLILKQIPVHYKYAPVIQDTLSVDQEGTFFFRMLYQHRIYLPLELLLS